MHYSLVVLCIKIGLRIIKTNGSLKKQLFCVWNINLRQFGSLKTDLIHKLVPAFFFFFLFRDQTFQPFKTRKYSSHIKFQRNQSILCLLFLNTQQRNVFIFILFVVFTAIFVPLIYFRTAIDLPVKDHVCSSPALTIPVSKPDHRPYLWPAQRGTYVHRERVGHNNDFRFSFRCIDRFQCKV